MDKPIFTLVKEDFQIIARERIRRDLTEDELADAIHYFKNGNQWAEDAAVCIDEAVK